MTLARMSAAAGVGAAALVIAAPASASPEQDQAFLSALDSQGIDYPSPQTAITIAQEVCTLLDDGAKGLDVSQEISKNSGVKIEYAGYFVGASIAAYCPSHRNAF